MGDLVGEVAQTFLQLLDPPVEIGIGLGRIGRLPRGLPELPGGLGHRRVRRWSGPGQVERRRPPTLLGDQDVGRVAGGHLLGQGQEAEGLGQATGAGPQLGVSQPPPVDLEGGPGVVERPVGPAVEVEAGRRLVEQALEPADDRLVVVGPTVEEEAIDLGGVVGGQAHQHHPVAEPEGFGPPARSLQVLGGPVDPLDLLGGGGQPVEGGGLDRDQGGPGLPQRSAGGAEQGVGPLGRVDGPAVVAVVEEAHGQAVEGIGFLLHVAPAFDAGQGQAGLVDRFPGQAGQPVGVGQVVEQGRQVAVGAAELVVQVTGPIELGQGPGELAQPGEDEADVLQAPGHQHLLVGEAAQLGSLVEQGQGPVEVAQFELAGAGVAEHPGQGVVLGRVGPQRIDGPFEELGRPGEVAVVDAQQAELGGGDGPDGVVEAGLGLLGDDRLQQVGGGPTIAPGGHGGGQGDLPSAPGRVGTGVGALVDGGGEIDDGLVVVAELEAGPPPGGQGDGPIGIVDVEALQQGVGELDDVDRS